MSEASSSKTDSDSSVPPGPMSKSDPATAETRKIVPVWWRRLLIIPPVLIGTAVFLWMRSNAGELPIRPQEEVARTLRVITVQRHDVVPRIEAYGTAQPGQIWRAVAEVRGRIVRVHPELKPGSILPEGEEVLLIDQTEYELAITQLTADIEQAQAQLEELGVREQNDTASLRIEKDALALSEQELARIQRLAEGNAATRADVDQQTRDTLAQRQKTQSLQNSLNLMPTEKKALAATIAVKQANLEQARLDLAKTKLVTPFDCRISEVSLEVGQFLGAGELLFEAHSTAVTEVEARIPARTGRLLVDPNTAPLGDVQPSMEMMRELVHAKARVIDTSGTDSAAWDARFLRIRENIDSRTRTLGLVVAVDEPYRKVIPGSRPPLMQGAYCRVVLRGAERSDRVIIPRSAIRDGQVYLVDDQNRLTRKSVTVDFTQGDLACLAEGTMGGLMGGETLIVSDPVPAIEGMLVRPQQDDETQTRLLSEVVQEQDESSDQPVRTSREAAHD